VVNPTPGGGLSNVVFFPVRDPAALVALFPTVMLSAQVALAGDFNNDGKQDVAVGVTSSDGGGEASGDYLVVEGTSHGKMSGKSWAGGQTPGGRFCNLFKFTDGRISSLRIYLDPDYTGEDEARFRWGRNRHW